MHVRTTSLVRDVMTKQPITIDPEAPLATAIAVMREKEIRHLPVVDNTGRLARDHHRSRPSVRGAGPRARGVPASRSEASG